MSPPIESVIETHRDLSVHLRALGEEKRSVRERIRTIEAALRMRSDRLVPDGHVQTHAVLAYVRARPGKRSCEIAEALYGVKSRSTQSNTSQRLQRLRRFGMLRKVDGLWFATQRV